MFRVYFSLLVVGSVMASRSLRETNGTLQSAWPALWNAVGAVRTPVVYLHFHKSGGTTACALFHQKTSLRVCPTPCNWFVHPAVVCTRAQTDLILHDIGNNSPIKNSSVAGWVVEPSVQL